MVLVLVVAPCVTEYLRSSASAPPLAFIAFNCPPNSSASASSPIPSTPVTRSGHGGRRRRHREDEEVLEVMMRARGLWALLLVALAAAAAAPGAVLAQGNLTSRSDLRGLYALRGSLGLRARDWPRHADPCAAWAGVGCRGGRVVSLTLVGLRRTRLGRLNPRFQVDGLQNLTQCRRPRRRMEEGGPGDGGSGGAEQGPGRRIWRGRRRNSSRALSSWPGREGGGVCRDGGG